MSSLARRILGTLRGALPVENRVVEREAPDTPPKVVFATNYSSEDVERLIEGCHFYHSFDLSNGIHIAGDWDASIGIEKYGFPDLRGKRVLEVGPASGWFSFYLEMMGAEVTVVETRGYGDFDVYGEDRYTGAAGRAPDRIVDGKPFWDGPVSGSFWAMHTVLNSKVQFVNGRIYEVGPELLPEPFDLVVVGALLLHLRDPIGALRALHSACKPGGLCIATTPTWEDRDSDPAPMQFLPWTSIDRISWWLPNKAAFEHWLSAAGFASIHTDIVIDYVPDAATFNENGVRMNQPMKLRRAQATA
jgi:SAM-dependent methyltransferase